MSFNFNHWTINTLLIILNAQQLDIISQNFTSPDDFTRPHTVTKIECVAFSSTGDWFATIDRWDDGQMTPEITLKFWAYVSHKQG